MRPRTAIGRTLTACALVTALTGGCAANSAGPPTIDPRALIPGNYPVLPRVIDRTEATGAVAEAIRLGETVPLLGEIDPHLTTSWERSPHILTPAAPPTALGGFSGDDLRTRLPAFETGFRASGSRPHDLGITLTLTVLRYPAPERSDAARSAFLPDPATNPVRYLPIPGFPTARARGGTVPGEHTAAIEAWLVLDRLLVVVTGTDTLAYTPDVAPLVERVAAVLARESTAASGYRPTPVEEWNSLPVDPDGLLGRTLPAEGPTVDPPAVFGPNAEAHTTATPPSTRRALAEAAVDTAASDGTEILRAGDADRARRLAAALADQLRSDGWTASAPPPGLPTAVCARREIGPRYRCHVVFDRYVGIVEARQPQDAAQRAAAQYLLLAHGH